MILKITTVAVFFLATTIAFADTTYFGIGTGYSYGYKNESKNYSTKDQLWYTYGKSQAVNFNASYGYSFLRDDLFEGFFGKHKVGVFADAQGTYMKESMIQSLHAGFDLKLYFLKFQFGTGYSNFNRRIEYDERTSYTDNHGKTYNFSGMSWVFFVGIEQEVYDDFSVCIGYRPVIYNLSLLSIGATQLEQNAVNLSVVKTFY